MYTGGVYIRIHPSQGQVSVDSVGHRHTDIPTVSVGVGVGTDILTHEVSVVSVCRYCQ